MNVWGYFSSRRLWDNSPIGESLYMALMETHGGLGKHPVNTAEPGHDRSEQRSDQLDPFMLSQALVALYANGGS